MGQGDPFLHTIVTNHKIRTSGAMKQNTQELRLEPPDTSVGGDRSEGGIDSFSIFLSVSSTRGQTPTSHKLVP